MTVIRDNESDDRSWMTFRRRGMIFQGRETIFVEFSWFWIKLYEVYMKQPGNVYEEKFVSYTFPYFFI